MTSAVAAFMRPGGPGAPTAPSYDSPKAAAEAPNATAAFACLRGAEFPR